jgi:hypothetical protein
MTKTATHEVVLDVWPSAMVRTSRSVGCDGEITGREHACATPPCPEA